MVWNTSNDCQNNNNNAYLFIEYPVNLVLQSAAIFQIHREETMRFSWSDIMFTILRLYRRVIEYSWYVVQQFY